MSKPPKPGPRKLDLSPKAALSALARKVSFQIETEGQATLGSLKDAADKNLAGPEAKFHRALKGLLPRKLRIIRNLEDKLSRLPKNSPKREQLEKKITLEARVFRNEVNHWAIQTAKEIEAQGGGALEKFKKLLPNYLQKCINREGAVIPGVPGSFKHFEKPLKDDVKKKPVGLEYKLRF